MATETRNSVPRRRPFVGGNWKMNTTLAAAVELTETVVGGADGLGQRSDIVLFPPAAFLQAVGRAVGHHPVAVGAQNFWPERSGAFTGEIGLEILDDLAIGTVLVGHSERRQHGRESDALIALKTAVALENGLQVVLCVGERLEEREAGDAEAIVCGQVRSALAKVPAERTQRLVIAYEPVWAIGTGRTATPQDAQEGHASIRRTLAERYDDGLSDSVRIIYGGSMNATNAPALLAEADVDGGLIGGASLDADSFLSICASACASVG